MPTITYTLSGAATSITYDFGGATPQRPDIVALNNGRILFGYGTDIDGIGGQSTAIAYFNSSNPLSTGGSLQGLLNLTTTGDQTDVSMEKLSSGQVVVAYTSEAAGNQLVRYHILNADGSIAAASDNIAANFAAVGMRRPDVAANTLTGGFAIAYDREISGTNRDGNIAFYDSAGAFSGRLAVGVGGAFTSTADVRNLSVTGLANGNYVATYQLNDGVNGEDVYFQRINSTGTALIDAAPILIDSFGTNTDIKVVSLADGGFVVTYTDTGWDAGSSGTDITARVYNADGTIRSSYLRVNSTNLAGNGGDTVNAQSEPDITVFENGNFAISWTTYNGSNNDIKTRLFDANGGALTGISNLVSGANNQVQSSIQTLGGSTFAAAWQDLTATNIVSSSNSFVRFTVGDATNENLLGDSMNDSMFGNSGNDILVGETLSTSGITLGTGVFSRLTNTNNNSFVNALDVGVNGWSLGANANIAGATTLPHISISSPADALSIRHFYKVDLAAGQTAIFDYDRISLADFAFELFDPNGALVLRVDDGNALLGGSGSDSQADPLDVYTALVSGFYTIKIGRYGSGAPLDNTMEVDPLLAGDSYSLQISLVNSQSSSDDFLNGGPGYDTLIGGAGDDLLFGDDNADVTIGGAGNDTFTFDAAGEYELGEIVDGGSGTDRITINNNAQNFGVSNTRSTPVSIEEIHLAGTGSATFRSSQFSADRISQNVRLITDGGGVVNTIDINTAGATSFSAAGFQFSNWDSVDVLRISVNNVVNTSVTGSSVRDEITGNVGNDTIDGGGGGDVMTGAQGDDTYYMDNTFDVVIEAAGGAGGNDQQFFSISGQAIGINVERGTLIGTANSLDGNGAINILTANALFGSTLNGFSGADTLIGLAGNDIFNGGAGADTMDGGTNSATGDTLSYEGSAAGVNINLALNTASGGDALGDIISNFENVTGSSLGDQLIGDNGANVLSGGAGNDLFVGGLGNDTIIGGADLDVVDYSSFGSGVAVNLTTGAGPGGDIISEIENITGSGFGDVLDGNNGANTMRGGAGNDFMVAGNGADLLIGGADNDEVSYATATTGVLVNLSTGTGANGGVLQEIENIRGSNFGDVLQGDNGANTIRGLDGNDFIIAGNGADLLIGGNDNDTVSYETATSGVFANLTTGVGANGGVLQEIENLTGSNFGDVLIGSALGNTLKGGGGNDFIVGNSGSDALEGGADNDTFRFETNTFGNDVIVDFQDNGDKLSFAAAVATNFSQFTILNNNTTNVTVQIAGQSIVVQGVANISLSAGDFLFV